VLWRYELKVDNITVSPSNYVYGTPITDWQSYTPTVTHYSGGVTNSTTTGRWRRVGDNIELDLKTLFSNTSAAFNGLLYSLPAGLSVDTTKINNLSFYGVGTVADTGTTNFIGGVRYYYSSGDKIEIQYENSGSAGAGDSYSVITNTAPFTFNNTDYVQGTIKLPIVGWSSSVQMSDSYDARLISTRIYKNGTQTYSTLTKLTSFTVDSDKTGMWDASNNRFNIQSPGDYQLFGNLYSTAATTANQQLAYKVNGGTTMYYGNAPNTSGAVDASMSGSDIIPNLKAGDYVEIYGYADASVTAQSGITASRFSLMKIASPQTISASESITCKYTTTAGSSFTDGVAAIVDFGTKEFDSHSAVTTGGSWKFTAPVSGVYTINGHIGFNIPSSTRYQITALLRKNGTETNRCLISTTQNSANTAMGLPFTFMLKLNAGDYIDLQAIQDSGASRNLLTNAGLNAINIVRIGN
jgi:hypothetical protein